MMSAHRPQLYFREFNIRGNARYEFTSVIPGGYCRVECDPGGQLRVVTIGADERVGAPIAHVGCQLMVRTTDCYQCVHCDTLYLTFDAVRDHIYAAHAPAPTRDNYPLYAARTLSENRIDATTWRTLIVSNREGDGAVVDAPMTRRIDRYRCLWCSRDCTSLTLLRAHMRGAASCASHGRDPRRLDTYGCVLCDYEGTTAADMYAHMATAHACAPTGGASVYVNGERVDPTTFARIYTCTYVPAHEPTRAHYCPICTHACSSIADYYKHMSCDHPVADIRDVIGDDIEYVCLRCDTKCMSMNACVRHMRVHPELRVDGQNDTLMHVKRVLDTRAIMCRLTPVHTHVPAAVREAVHTSPPRVRYGNYCPICGRICSSATDCREHIARVHPERAMRPRAITDTREETPCAPSAVADCASALAGAPMETAHTDSSSSADTTCVICMSAPRDTAVIPCGHFGFCGNCISAHMTTSRDCPICRARIASVHKIHSC